jgi:predicted MFS family arabinose efflux permease
MFAVVNGMRLIGAVSVGIIVTNLFASQVLFGAIAATFQMNEQLAGMIATLTLFGYACGLFLLVPLADIFENRRLILAMLLGLSGACCATAIATQPALLFAAVLVMGMLCATIQILVPLIASMEPVAQRGRVIGGLMSGVTIGMVLSRPWATLVADVWGWRGFYLLSAAEVLLLVGLLAWRLPPLQPATQMQYAQLLGSFWALLREERILRVRAWTAALGMAAFANYWAAAVLVLTGAPFQLGAHGVAIFAFVGAVGAAATPIAGILGDRGWARPLLVMSHVVICVSLLLCAMAGQLGSQVWAIVVLGIGTVLFDVAVTTDQTIGRRAVNILRPEARGRLNGLFAGLFFVGGAVGAAAGAMVWPIFGWAGVCGIGVAFGALALVNDGVEWVRTRAADAKSAGTERRGAS